MRRALAAGGLLLGCGGDADTNDSAAGGTPASCGPGPAPGLEIGTGGSGAFSPYADGDPVPISEQNGALGVRLELQTTDIDAGQEASAFVNLTFDPPETETYGATLTLVCDPASGTGWFAFFAALPEPYATDPTPLDGRLLPFEAVLTDALGTSVSDDGSITLVR